MTQETLKQLISTSLEESLNYEAYIGLVNEQAITQRTSGPNQKEDLIYYTKLNAQRVKRLNKTVALTREIREAAESIKTPQTWLVLSESWCGDAAQILPLLHKITEANELISLRVVFRDEHIALMDQFLTNGSRSIPKLLILDEELEVLGTWGPRPQAAQDLYNSWKNDPDKPPYREFQVEMQKWYLTDKGRSTFEEVGHVLQGIDRKAWVA